MARLATCVHVYDEHGTPHVFGTDDDVPKWAADRITNPAAWDEEPEREPEPAYPEGEPSDGWKVPQLVAYARDEGIDLGDAKKKDDILALILHSLGTGDNDDDAVGAAADQ
ncbi:hypothetical protein M1M07_07695 [Rhodococcus sp. HM1]|uniref:hypothetical protein n=1 Tax=Rhodococcus sp. HM1 TaxID=2937759 RepID=UPI00200B054C|nr:hypothetical protein [Rhodococcus sp. HM1]MCK8671000.1 hypothetical protein [Rhodococcus sp. HM1]